MVGNGLAWRALAALTAMGGLSGCEAKEVPLKMALVTKGCDAKSPTEGASHFRFRLSGDGITPVEKVEAVSKGGLRIPEIPAGTARVLEVRAYDGDPAAGGKVVALGRTLPFDVPDVVPANASTLPEVNVFMRRVNTFSEVGPADGSGCSRLKEARAGHSATLLPDGRVFIAGGFQTLAGTSRKTLEKTEYFNPATGMFEEGPDMGLFNTQQKFLPTSRAFHTATLLPTGQVFIAGGESTVGTNTSPNAVALVFDPPVGEYGGLQLMSPRTRHAAAVDVGGRVLLVGGTGNNGTLVDSVEWFDPGQRKSFKVEGLTLPRLGASAAPVQGGKFVIVAGGSDGSVLKDSVLFFSHDGTSFKAATSTVRLKELRRASGMATFDDGNKVLMAGGYRTATETGAGAVADSTEVVSTGQSFAVSEGPKVSARGDVCAVPLPDGRVFIAGGRTALTGLDPKSEETAELLLPDATARAKVETLPSIPGGRHFHTCTLLNDGSVLVTGGLREANVSFDTLQDAYLFMPAPLD